MNAQAQVADFQAHRSMYKRMEARSVRYQAKSKAIMDEYELVMDRLDDIKGWSLTEVMERKMLQAEAERLRKRLSARGIDL